MQSATPGTRPSVRHHLARISVSETRWVFLALVALGAASMFEGDWADGAGASGVALGFGAASVVFLRNARAIPSRRERAAWQLIGSGLGLGSIGVLATIGWSVVAPPVPAFSAVDLAFVTSYVLVLAAVALLPQASGGGLQRARLLVDGLIGAIALTSIFWVTFLFDMLSNLAGTDGWEGAVGSAYPILDVAALIAVATLFMSRSNMRFDARLLLLAVGIAFQSAADLAFLFTGLGSTFEESQPNYLLHIIPTVAYLGAAIMVPVRPKAREYADQQPQWWTSVIPYALVIALSVVLLISLETGGFDADSRLLAYSVLTVIGLVVIRQTAAIRENRSLVEQERRALVSSISHELRTPLTAVVGFLDLVRSETTDEDEQTELLSIAYEQTRHVARIVSDLVALARDSVAGLQLHDSMADVGELIDLTTHTISDGHEPRTIISAEVDVNLRALVDRDRLQQIIENLVGNAVRYGGGMCLVVARAEHDTLHIEVHDTGAGVPTKYEYVIWDRFERGSRRLDATTPGSGIGLAIVKMIAQAYGGSVGYRRSERLGGACFFIELPGRVVGASPTQLNRRASSIAG
ncbi:MAG: HAMP domain-containing sensor histidine kinase [Acidimicrobiia bacterium]|nr:HAMP domain-containing sensor histidine kinase [Acidimicrobiia bacterium]